MSMLTERLRNLTNDCGFIDGAVAAARIEHLERVLGQARSGLRMRGKHHRHCAAASFASLISRKDCDCGLTPCIAAIDEAMKEKT